MSKIILFIIFCIALTLISLRITQAQWQPDVRLTNDPSTSYTSTNNVWNIVANGDKVFVVWSDKRIGLSGEIFCKISSDRGYNWGDDTRLTFDPASSDEPSVSVSGQNLHIVWEDFRDGYRGLYYKGSTNAGLSWMPDFRLSIDTANKEFPSVSASGLTVHVVWDDYRDGNSEIYYKRSTDNGLSWGADTRLTFDSASSRSNNISVSGSFVFITWHDWRNGNPQIYCKFSTDNGTSWSADTKLTNSVSGSWCACSAVSGNTVHIIWEDNRDGNFEIYYKKSTNRGLNWGADVRLTNNIAESDKSSISVLDSIVHVVWEDERDGNNEIYYKRSTTGGSSWEQDTRLTNASGNSYHPSISTSGSAIHVVWTDTRDGNSEIYYKCNPTGNLIGIQPVSSEIPNRFSVSQNYPNPFNPVTKIKFDIPLDSRLRGNDNITLKIYDVLGREVATLVNEQLTPGKYKVQWDASNYPSGVYFYRLTTSDFTQTKKMVLIK